MHFMVESFGVSRLARIAEGEHEAEDDTESYSDAHPIENVLEQPANHEADHCPQRDKDE